MSILFFPFVYICMFLFTVGMGFILSTISVFLRDIFHTYRIVLPMWQYFTPLFYDIKMIAPNLQIFFKFNPVYQFINFTREIILYNRIPNLECWLSCAGFALLFFSLGCVIFKSKQDRFIDYA